jgi:hypothetical protein
MWTLHTANPEHWVPISTVGSFKRMRDFSSLGMDWVVKALQLSEELEVDETNTKVRRRTEVQEPKDQFQRSIYAVRRSACFCFVFIYNERVSERFWEGRTHSSAKIGRLLWQVWQGQCSANETHRQYQGIQGSAACVVTDDKQNRVLDRALSSWNSLISIRWTHFSKRTPSPRGVART